MNNAASLAKVADLFQTHQAFIHCNQEELARLLSKINVKKFKKDETLFKAEQKAQNLYFILHGSVKVENDKIKNNTVNDIVGQESILGMSHYLSDVSAKTDSQIVELPIAELGAISAEVNFHQHVVDSFYRRLADKPIKEKTITKTDTDEEDDSAHVSYRVLLGWLAVLVCPLLVYYFLNATEGSPLSENAIIFAAILTSSSVMWIFRLLPDHLPSLFAVLGAVLLGVTNGSNAFVGFSSNSFFMALSILGLSVVIRSSGLSYRVLLHLLRIGPESKVWYNISFFSVGALLTPIVPTVNGRVAIVAPFLKDLLSGMSKKAGKAEGPRLKASLLFGTSLLSPIFLSSKSVNFIMFGMLPQQTQQAFQWLDWFIAASVCGGVLLILYSVTVFILYRHKQKVILPKYIVRQQISTLGALNPAEWSGVIGLLVLVGGLIFSSTHNIEVAWVALAIMFYLMMFGFLSPKDLRTKVDWNFLIFLGSLIGMINIINQVGLDSWLITHISWLSVYMKDDLSMFVALLALITTLVRLILPINATVIILATLLIPAAVAVNVNPWVIGFLILFLSETFFWPYQASYYLNFLSITQKHNEKNDPKMLILSIFIYIFKLVAIYISIPFWQNMGFI
ncbi:MAG: anion permease [Saccharospirillaceae bacterium]|nr:anion permease [Pseudomonadales bacterium]NRB78061.1 anion permease [Saccharospirillaceae bacterium]